MSLLQKLLGYLNRVFDKDPGKFLALRLNYAGAMTWSIVDGILTTMVVGGVGAPLNIDLSQYTIQGLVTFIAGQAGYSVSYIDRSGYASLSALVLIDDANDQSLSNGDHVYGFTSLLWSWMAAQAKELSLAGAQIANLPAEMSTPTADGYWLDYIGGLFGFPRKTVTISGTALAEPDYIYAPRIPNEVIRPRGNNIAIAMAISDATGGQAGLVVDAVAYGSGTPAYDGSITYNGAHLYNASAALIYGLFDVQYAFDLEGSFDLTELAATVVDTVEKFRDAGTHLRAVAVVGSTLTDFASAPPVDAGAAMTVFHAYVHDGSFRYDGSHPYSGGVSIAETLL